MRKCKEHKFLIHGVWCSRCGTLRFFSSIPHGKNKYVRPKILKSLQEYAKGTE